jgi:response regulator RpfG family c-di-GMP phosphodiesterase
VFKEVMKMSLITIVSVNQIESKKIQELLADVRTDKYRVQFEFLRPLQLSQKLDRNTDLLVYNNPNNLTMTLQQQITGWRRNGFLSSILLLTKLADPTAINTVESLSSCVLLEKPFDEKDLRGIAEKFLNTEQVQQRKFRRYATQQTVNVSSYMSEFHTPSKVNNMSLGGVRIEGAVQDLRVGELVKINFSLDKLNVERVMNGRVVWIDADRPQPSAGIQFMKESEIYGQLLREIS